MDQRRFVYIYSLAYPAVLGSFLFAFLAAFPAMSWDRFVAALLMLVYFLIQYGEGVVAGQSLGEQGIVRGHRYGWLRFVQDSLEVAVIVGVFGTFSLFASPRAGLGLPLYPLNWIAMVAAFAIPPVFRAIRTVAKDSLAANDQPSGRDDTWGKKLSILSGIAVIVCGAAAVLAGFTDSYNLWALLVLGLLMVWYVARYVRS